MVLARSGYPPRMRKAALIDHAHDLADQAGELVGELTSVGRHKRRLPASNPATFVVAVVAVVALVLWWRKRNGARSD